MNFKIKENIFLKVLGGNLSSIVAVCVGIWFLGEGTFNNKVDKRIGIFLDSPTMAVYINNIIENVKKEQETKDSGKIKLRKLLAKKMQCDEDEVHIRLGILYISEKKNLEDAELERKELKNRIKILENKNN